MLKEVISNFFDVPTYSLFTKKVLKRNIFEYRFRKIPRDIINFAFICEFIPFALPSRRYTIR